MTYIDVANQYVADVLAGNVVACKWVRLACERQQRDLARAEEGDPAFPFRFDAEAAERICHFIEMLPHTKGRWARTKQRIILEPWQVFILTTVFGWLRVDADLRRYRRAYEEVARKNGKSAKSSGIALYLFGADNEPGAEVYSAATTRDQARIVFDDARRMALREPEMCEALGIEVLQHQMIIEEEACKFVPLSSEGSTLDGLNIHGGIIDELHAHKTRDVFDVIDSATGARDQSLLWMITTAGTDRSGICYEQRIHVTKVLEGTVVDETFFGIIFTLDEGDDWTDPAVWVKANPNLGVSVLVDDMEMACRKAMSMSSAVANFLTKRLNVWVNADSAWMDMRAWDRCANPAMLLEDFRGLECYVALDLASKVDIAAKVLLFPPQGERRKWALFGKYYLPERAIENSTNSQFDGWRRSGLLEVTDGEVTDYDEIEQGVLDDCAMFSVTEVPYDPFQATQLSGHLISQGVPMTEMRPTVLNFSEPMKQLEALVLKGEIEHNGDPVMTWMISNVVCHVDKKDNIYPNKERPENKIDGPVAAIMALGRAMALADQVPVIGDDYELMTI
ncbi:terminase large subunit [Cupriavidus sp. YAF13]|uniref:terminase large subunit n=1 Tax=Cupriavidus sp. YAF13 TaxID=3233075 RepID=UPI003F912C57